jgi:hypothetical protein
MKALLIEDNGDTLTIKLNKAEFDSSFLESIVKRMEFERLTSKAQIDPSIVTYFKSELSNSFNESQAQYYKGKGN